MNPNEEKEKCKTEKGLFFGTNSEIQAMPEWNSAVIAVLKCEEKKPWISPRMDGQAANKGGRMWQ